MRELLKRSFVFHSHSGVEVGWNLFFPPETFFFFLGKATRSSVQFGMKRSYPPIDSVQSSLESFNPLPPLLREESAGPFSPAAKSTGYVCSLHCVVVLHVLETIFVIFISQAEGLDFTSGWVLSFTLQ